MAIDNAQLASGMNARLAQLQGAYVVAGDQASGLVNQSLLSQTDVDSVLMQTGTSIALLGGDLYNAVLGSHNFPLDTGTAPDQASAGAAWDQLAQSVQDTLTNVLGYQGGFGSPWSVVKTLAQMGLDAVKPVLEPLAGGAILFGLAAVVIFFAPELFGAARTVKAVAGVSRKSRRPKPRRWW